MRGTGAASSGTPPPRPRPAADPAPATGPEAPPSPRPAHEDPIRTTPPRDRRSAGRDPPLAWRDPPPAGRPHRHRPSRAAHLPTSPHRKGSHRPARPEPATESGRATPEVSPLTPTAPPYVTPNAPINSSAAAGPARSPPTNAAAPDESRRGGSGNGTRRETPTGSARGHHLPALRPRRTGRHASIAHPRAHFEWPRVPRPPPNATITLSALRACPPQCHRSDPSFPARVTTPSAPRALPASSATNAPGTAAAGTRRCPSGGCARSSLFRTLARMPPRRDRPAQGLRGTRPGMPPYRTRASERAAATGPAAREPRGQQIAITSPRCGRGRPGGKPPSRTPALASSGHGYPSASERPVHSVRPTRPSASFPPRVIRSALRALPPRVPLALCPRRVHPTLRMLRAAGRRDRLRSGSGIGRAAAAAGPAVRQRRRERLCGGGGGTGCAAEAARPAVRQRRRDRLCGGGGGTGRAAAVAGPAVRRRGGGAPVCGAPGARAVGCGRIGRPPGGGRGA